MREQTVFFAALDITDPIKRAAYLDQVCAGDADLRIKVEELLRAHEESGRFMDQPAAEQLSTTGERPISEGPGTVIGPYKLLEQIGEGGFGVVFMAEQHSPVRRKVALKIIKPGMDTRQVIARFEAERQALALMDHPNIAKVFDAGSTETGRPYFVMELVRGIPITRFCDENHLPVPDRLRLFVTVCQAVQHAHQKGIIHRDLKPTNILVTLHDNIPVVKVIDFGVAKATGQQLTERTLFTAFAQMVGTPIYMSPEQAQMSGLDVDTRSDVYSLGVLLYELLTATTPFDRERLRAAAFDEIRRIIREEEPPKPSTRLSTLGPAATRMSADRKSDLKRLRQLFRGELDWIVMKALEKDRSRRYETANGFAMDVQRYLSGEPVLAVPPSAAYRLRKFARRNKVALTTAALVLIAMLLGTAVSAWQAVRATRAERQAVADQQATATAQAKTKLVNQFLADLIQEFTPDENPRSRLAPEIVLRKAIEKMETDPALAGQPDVEATIRHTIGQAYWKLGLNTEAEAQLRRATKLRQDALGPDDPDTLAAQEALAWVVCIELRRYPEGEPLSRDTLAACRRVLPPNHPTTLEALTTHGSTLQQLTKFSEAEPILLECWEGHIKVYGPTHAKTLRAQNNYGVCLSDRGEWTRAAEILRSCLKGYRDTAGLDSEGAIGALMNLAGVLRRGLSKFEEAESLLREGQEPAARLFGADHPKLAHMQFQLLQVLVEEKKYAEAEVCGKEAVKLFSKAYPPGHEAIARAQTVLGRTLVEAGKYTDAEPPLREAVALFRERYPTKQAYRGEVESWLGACLAGQKKYPDAEPLLLSGYERMKGQPGVPARYLDTTRKEIIRLYESMGKSEKADEWRGSRKKEEPMRD
jgi:serine/threonine protein kinase/tetratricopeptide (TPR) repeat protein